MPKEKADKVFQMRLTASDLNRWKEEADKLGLKPSQFVRAIVNGYCEKGDKSFRNSLNIRDRAEVLHADAKKKLQEAEEILEKVRKLAQ